MKISVFINYLTLCEKIIIIVYKCTRRNCLIIHFSDIKTLNITENEKKFLSKFHPFIHEGNISEISKRMEECIKNIERNANAKIMFYELSLQLMTLLKVNRKFEELN